MAMPRRAWLPALLATAIAILPSSAPTAGSITGLTASPDPGFVNQAVVFTLQGTGDLCLEIRLDYGDGFRESLKLARFDRGVGLSAPPHFYPSPGTYTVTATAAQECEGTAQMQFTVSGQGSEPPPGPTSTGLPPGSARDTAVGVRGLTQSGSSSGTGGRDRGAPPRDTDSGTGTGRGRPYEDPAGSPPPRGEPSPLARQPPTGSDMGFKGATRPRIAEPGPATDARRLRARAFEEPGRHPDYPVPRDSPRIDSVFPFSVISPGGGVILLGSGFGANPGQVRMQILNHPYSYLGELSWSDNSVGGTIDPDLAGLTDQQVALYVVTASGVASNIVRVRFTARRELVLLPPGDVDSTCGRESDVNECGFSEPSWSPPPTFTGRHRCTGAFDPYFGCNDAGRDGFYTGFSLRSGWKVDHGELQVYRGRASLSGLEPDRSAPSGTVSWDTLEYTSLYSVNVYVSGPAGTSYK